MIVNRKKVLSLFIAFVFTIIMASPAYVNALDEDVLDVETHYVSLIQEGATNQYVSFSYAKTYDAGIFKTPTLEEAMYNAFLNVEPTVNVSRYKATQDEVMEVFRQIINKSPELFYVDNKIMNYYNALTGYVAVTYLYYNYTYDEIVEMRQMFEEEVDYIISTLDENMSDLEKALAVHEYFLVHFSYDYTYSIYNAYDLLINKTGVCQAYALAYKYVLNKLGIECWIVTSDTVNHAWNIVKIDGKYYHVDATWNDDYRTLGKASHGNFLKSENAIVELGHVDINEFYVADDKTYDDYFWIYVTNALTYLNGKWYYISNSGNLTSYDFATGKKESVYKPKIHKYSYEIYSNVIAYNGRLLYNSDNTIYTVNADGSEETPIYTLSEDETRRIFGIAIYKENLVFTLKYTGDDEDDLQYIPLSQLLIDEPTEPTETTTVTEEPIETTTTEITEETTTTEIIEDPIVLGDLDGDGTVTIIDVVILIKVLQGNYNLPEDLAVNADIAEDGKINIYDLVEIKQLLYDN
jgi:hypothetical protein